MSDQALAVLLSLTAFAVVHSFTAAPASKRLVRTLLGERFYHGFYRLFYNIFSAITVLPVLFVLATQPGPVVWRVEGVAAQILTVTQLLSVLGLVIAGLQIDVWRFAGLRQAYTYLVGDPLPLPPEPFIQSGMYGLVRHPLYLFSTLYIWTFPTMYVASVAFAAGSTLYFVIGAQFEERRLAREIGPAYEVYRCHVPFLIPFVGVTARCPDAPLDSLTD
ncbi:MAG: isoprenylcysteine carboxylmethyltransferase family protein [Anaerolineae bacterium]|nr:isoprenylcysteine carboxylmethyltransferase family protein [Anaerolineae bacterium]